MKRSTLPPRLCGLLAVLLAASPGLRAQAPPRIVEPPQDQYVPAGTEVVLRVVAEGDEPLSYQWLRQNEETSVDEPVPGAPGPNGAGW